MTVLIMMMSKSRHENTWAVQSPPGVHHWHAHIKNISLITRIRASDASTQTEAEDMRSGKRGTRGRVQITTAAVFIRFYSPNRKTSAESKSNSFPSIKKRVRTFKETHLTRYKIQISHVDNSIRWDVFKEQNFQITDQETLPWCQTEVC